MKIDLNEIEKRIDDGLIRRQWTEDGSLMILNYTQRCTYERIWDEYTTLARGLILRKDGTIHARSMSKFWNLSEPPGPSIDSLPNEDPVITLKLDGFLGLTYAHEGRIKVASRGSFTSEYARWATKWLWERNPAITRDTVERQGYTYVFEILYPYRRIVVDNSGKYGLVLLTVVNNETGLDLPRIEVEAIAKLCRWEVVPAFETHSIADCVELARHAKGTEQEGFVAHYPKAGIRVKIKGEDYSKIHRIVTRLTKRRVWEVLSSGNGSITIDEMRSVLPEQYVAWMDGIVTDLMTEYMDVRQSANNAAKTCDLLKRTGAPRRVVVDALSENFPDVFHEALYIHDGKFDKAEACIWKRLRPEHETPLVQDGSDE